MMKYVQGLVLVALAVMAGATAGQAQTWPQRPVKVLVPFAAGGNIDVMGRLAASRLSEAFGQQFVVENRVGGNGIIATEAVARSPADGGLRPGFVSGIASRTARTAHTAVMASPANASGAPKRAAR